MGYVDYKNLFDTYELPLIILDLKGNYIDYNTAYMNLFGYTSKEQLVSYRPENVSPPLQPDGQESKEKANYLIQMAIEKGHIEFEWAHMDLNHNEFISYVIVDLIEFNEQKALKVTIKDIDETKRLEKLVKKKTKKIKEQEIFFKNIIDEIPNPIIIKNKEGKFVLVNKALSELYDTSIEEMIGKDDGDFIDNLELVEFYRQNIKDIIDSQKTQVVYEDSIDKKRDELRNFMSIKKPIKNEKGEDLVLVIANDITELNTKDRLIHEQTKMSALGEMIENIAHQWRQPLQIISLASSAVKFEKDFGKVSNELIDENMNKILENSTYLSKTIDNFRDFIKKSKKKQLYELHEVLDRAILNVEKPLLENNISLIREFDEDLVLEGFPEDIIQALINIINNAKEALVEKRVINRAIFISTSIKDNQIVIKIKDNAYGASKEVIDKIFEPYFTTKHKSKGIGLGLYNTYKLITVNNGGSIEVKNTLFKYRDEDCKGLKFTLFIPLAL